MTAPATQIRQVELYHKLDNTNEGINVQGDSTVDTSSIPIRYKNVVRQLGRPTPSTFRPGKLLQYITGTKGLAPEGHGFFPITVGTDDGRLYLSYELNERDE